MKVSELIRLGRDQRTKKWRRLSQRKGPDDADTPDNYKKQTGRCPPGFFINDDSGRCEKVSPRKQQQRDRKNQKLRNHREHRRNRHPKLNRHSEVSMKISERIRSGSLERKGKTLQEKDPHTAQGVAKHVRDIVRRFKGVGDVNASIRKLLSDLRAFGVKDPRYDGVARAYEVLDDAMDKFVDQLHELQKDPASLKVKD